jgi:hypothetical protein
MRVYCEKKLYFYSALLKIFWKKSGNQTIKKLSPIELRKRARSCFGQERPICIVARKNV